MSFDLCSHHFIPKEHHVANINFGEKLFKKMSSLVYMNVLRVLFMLHAVNSNCGDSITDHSCF